MSKDNGPTGVVLLEFVGDSTRFGDLDPERQAEIAFREAGE